MRPLATVHALALLPALALVLAAALPARAQDDFPQDWREAQTRLRDAVRDTVGHGDDAGRLSTLGQALVRLGRWNDATKVLDRVLALQPNDRPSLAALGKIALYHERTGEAESLLVAAGDAEGAVRDLYAARLRTGDWKGAAALAEEANDEGRLPLLERLQQLDAFQVLKGPATAKLRFARAYPVPLVKASLNGHQVLVALDPGCPGVLVDPTNVRAAHLEELPGERAVFWIGSHVAAGNAIAQQVELGGIQIANVPVATTSLHRYSLDVNPLGRDIGMVLGLDLLERLGVRIDFKKQYLELRRERAVTDRSSASIAPRVPFERWTENQLVVWGSIGGGRRLSMIVGTGLPGAGFGGPYDTFEELGLKPGKMANLMRGVGTALQGRPWAAATVPTLSVGSVVGDRVNGWMGAMDPGEAWREGVRLDGLLGPDWFSRRRVTFDWVRHELIFESR